MNASLRSVVLHGHFYQPPREDPWFETVDAQPTALPDHDWNARIERECYRAVVAARIMDSDGRIERIVNTLEHISFNVGPTLLSWLEREAPRTYQAILEADQRSQERLGHGNAMAMAYHHPILPLSDARDRITEVRWGIADFRQRFGRTPEGMWLPETAVDAVTLDALAQEGIRFTVLAPHQLDPIPSDGGPGLFRTPSGRSIALFPYDGELARGVAFGELLRDATTWASRWAAPHDPRSLVSIAVDGETFGHHHRFADLALAATLHHLAQRPDVRIENFASYLARHPATQSVQLVEPSAWSCAHGVDRWRRECGCKMDPSSPARQTWRAPLREAVTGLARDLHTVFESEGARHFTDPWRARDAYGAVLRVTDHRARWDALAGVRAHPESDPVRGLELLEMERNALRIFTSCAWFFDDLAGIEPVQILRYAARGIELSGSARERIEGDFRRRLSRANSNDPKEGSGMDLYDRRARASVAAETRAAAGGAFLHRLARMQRAQLGAFDTSTDEEGGVEVEHRPTGRDWLMHAEVHARRQSEWVVQVRTANGDTHAVDEALIPEAARNQAGGSLRARLLERVLTDADRERLAEGASMAAVARTACQRVVQTLIEAETPDRGPQIARALEAGGLVQLLGLDVPFDAQTDLWRWMEREGFPADVADLARQFQIAVRAV